MIRTVIVFAFCLMAIAPPLSPQTVSSPTNTARDVEVTQVIDRFVEAWNRHDVAAMMAVHTDNVNFTNITGQWWTGKQQVAEGVQKVHATVFAKSSMTLHSDQVRFLSDSIAVVHGTMELHNVPPSAQGECHFMRVLVKQNGTWLIDDFQNTIISNPAQK